MSVTFFLLLMYIVNCLGVETVYFVNDYLLSSAIIGKVYTPTVDEIHWLNTVGSSEFDFLTCKFVP